MKETKELNKNFEAINGLKDSEYNILLAEKRIFCTNARFTGIEAEKVFNDGKERSFEERTYQGYIITTESENFEEARLIALLRGFDEYNINLLVEETDGNNLCIINNN